MECWEKMMISDFNCFLTQLLIPFTIQKNPNSNNFQYSTTPILHEFVVSTNKFLKPRFGYLSYVLCSLSFTYFGKICHR